MGRSVGKLFFLTSQIPYSLHLIVNSPNIGNKTKYTNNAKLNIFYHLKIYSTVYIGQFSQFAMKGHMTLWPIYAQFSKDQNSALELLLLF